jgi:hypothetical protein
LDAISVYGWTREQASKKSTQRLIAWKKGLRRCIGHASYWKEYQSAAYCREQLNAVKKELREREHSR